MKPLINFKDTRNILHLKKKILPYDLFYKLFLHFEISFFPSWRVVLADGSSLCGIFMNEKQGYTNNFDPITTNCSVISRRNRFASTSLLWTLIVICHCQQFIILNKDNVFTGNLITCMSWPTPSPPPFRPFFYKHI